jgi:outer membrane lipoprotein-sorting protein
MKRNLILLIILMNVAFLGATDSANKIIRNVEKKLTSAQSIRVHFTETYIWELTGEESSLEGELILGNGDRFRITTEDQIIVSDGTTLYTYSKPSHRVLIDKLSSDDNTLLPRQILFHYKKDYRAIVQQTESVKGIPCTVLEFHALSKDIFVPEIRVWIDTKAWVPRQVEQTDLEKNRTIYFLNTIEFDIPLPPLVFQLEIPEGADVVNMK